MTTLKQIQEKICNSKPHCTLDENDNCEKCSRLAVREWLQQKPIKPPTIYFNGKRLDFNYDEYKRFTVEIAGYDIVIFKKDLRSDELLKELET